MVVGFTVCRSSTVAIKEVLFMFSSSLQSCKLICGLICDDKIALMFLIRDNSMNTCPHFRLWLVFDVVVSPVSWCFYTWGEIDNLCGFSYGWWWNETRFFLTHLDIRKTTQTIRSRSCTNVVQLLTKIEKGHTSCEESLKTRKRIWGSWSRSKYKTLHSHINRSQLGHGDHTADPHPSGLKVLVY